MSVEFEIEWPSRIYLRSTERLHFRVTSTDVTINAARYNDTGESNEGEPVETCSVILDPAQARKAAEWLLWAIGDDD